MAKKKLTAGGLAKDASTDELAEVGFEESLSELEQIVRRLEHGGGALDEALKDYAKAIHLLKHCHARLETAERQIEILSGFDALGNPVTNQMRETEKDLDEKQAGRASRRSAPDPLGLEYPD
ncbi:MAG: exodeoxyribonuclease VII small subunit [Planctomycetales bacterium]|nr:exodeoxyribonuclease VII small subunit [Planctomycetales bacterium]